MLLMPTNVVDHQNAQVASATSFSSMKQRATSTAALPWKHHLRKGVAGGWRDVFTVRESEAFDEIYDKLMQGSHLRMDFGEGLSM